MTKIKQLTVLSQANRKRKDAINALHFPMSPLFRLIAQFYLFGNVTGGHWLRELRTVLSDLRDCCYLVGNKCLKREDIFKVITQWHPNLVATKITDLLKDPDYDQLTRIHTKADYLSNAELHESILDLIADYVDSRVNRDSDESDAECATRIVRALT